VLKSGPLPPISKVTRSQLQTMANQRSTPNAATIAKIEIAIRRLSA
jgi:hypothetical protein